MSAFHVDRFGDSWPPNEGSTALMEKLVENYITDLTMRACIVANRYTLIYVYMCMYGLYIFRNLIWFDLIWCQPYYYFLFSCLLSSISSCNVSLLFVFIYFMNIIIIYISFWLLHFLDFFYIFFASHHRCHVQFIHSIHPPYYYIYPDITLILYYCNIVMHINL